MDFIVITAAGAREDYLLRKVKATAENMGLDENISIPVIAKAPARPQVALAHEFFAVTGRQQVLAEAAQRCALRDVAEQWPLLEGEEIEEDTFSYLLAPYDTFAAYTAVLLRKTNMAELAYFFGLVRIEDGNVVYLPPQERAQQPSMPRALLSEKTMKFIKKLLASGATSGASAAGSKLGTMLLNLALKEIFGMDNDTEKLLIEIRKIVKEEIESNEMARIEGTLTGTLDYLTIQYRRQKEKKDLANTEDRKDLLALLEPFNAKMQTDVIGLLKTEKYSRKGIKTFMLAAAVHLVLMQEMALVDPKYKNPNDSGYLLTLQDLAVNYRSFVRSVYERAMNERNNMTIGTEIPVIDPRAGVTKPPITFWRDNVSNEKETGFIKTSNPPTSGEEKAKASLEEHRKKVLNKLKEDMGNPPDTFLADVEGFVHFKFVG